MSLLSECYNNLMKNTKKQKGYPADLVFAPTLAFARFSEDLLLRYAMITAASCSAAYVDPFARTWPGFSTTDPGSSYILYCLAWVGKEYLGDKGENKRTNM